MFEFQVYNKTSRKYVTIKRGGKDAMILNMTLGYLHLGARRRVRTQEGKILVKR